MSPRATAAATATEPATETAPGTASGGTTQPDRAPLPDAAGIVGAGAAATAVSSTPPQGAEPKRRGSPLGVIIGGILAGGIGFGAAWYGYEEGYLGADVDTSALEQQLASLQSQLEALDGDNSALRDQLDSLAGRDVVVADELAARDAQISGAYDEIAALEARMAAREALNIASPAELDDVSRALGENLNRLAALESEVTALVESDALDQLAVQTDSRIGAQEEITSRLAVQVSSVQAELSGLLDEIGAVRELAEKQLADVQAEADAAAAAAAARAAQAEARAALDSIAGALESGAPFGVALARIEAAGETAPDALQASAATGVATVAELQDSFAPAARAGLTAALQHAETDSTTDRLTNFLRSQVGARSLSAREGDDPDAVMSRAEAAVREGDIARALDEIATLPEAGITAMGGWYGRASARVAAQSALADLQLTFDAE